MDTRSKRVREAQLEDAAEFCVFPQLATEVSSWEQQSLEPGRHLARALARLTRGVTTDQILSSTVNVPVERFVEAVEYFSRPGWLKRPGLLFRRPKELPKVCLSTPYPMGDGEVIDLTCSSRYQPVFRPGAREFLSFANNKTVYARMWRHPPGRSLGRIIAIHGWSMGDQRLNALTMVPGWFFRLGLDVIVYELPFHGRRVCADAPPFPSAHIALTNEGFLQSIFELRRLCAWLKHESKLKVGVIGMSLGGYVAALWAALDKLDFAIPVVPLSSIPDAARGYLEQVCSIGPGGPNPLCSLPFDKLAAAYLVHSPLSYAPKTPRENQMIIASRSDAILDPTQSTMLWEAWGKPEIHWLGGQHHGQILDEQAFTVIGQFLRQRGLAMDQPLRI